MSGYYEVLYTEERKNSKVLVLRDLMDQNTAETSQNIMISIIDTILHFLWWNAWSKLDIIQLLSVSNTAC